MAHCSIPSTCEVDETLPQMTKEVREDLKVILRIFLFWSLPYPLRRGLTGLHTTWFHPQHWDYRYVSMPGFLNYYLFFKYGAGAQVQIPMFTEESPLPSKPSPAPLSFGLHFVKEGYCAIVGHPLRGVLDLERRKGR